MDRGDLTMNAMSGLPDSASSAGFNANKRRSASDVCFNLKRTCSTVWSKMYSSSE